MSPRGGGGTHWQDMTDGRKKGPLAGLRVVEMAAIGPVPLAGLLLADMGATVLRIGRLHGPDSFLPLDADFDIGLHGRHTLRVDLKAREGAAVVRRIAAAADILLEGFRPGVMERLELGPDELCAANPRLIYGRMTGFGQDGPLAQQAGHDLNYLSITGTLGAIGPAGGKPMPPLNLVGDYGGGTMFLVAGILAALFERATSGHGQVVDAAMVDGTGMLAASIFGLHGAGLWQDRRASNMLDGGTPFYDTYETKDGGYVAVACLEPQFFAVFSDLLPLPEAFAGRQYDRTHWPQMREAIAARFLARTRDEWDAVFAGSDACVTPVLSFGEAPDHPHNKARAAHVPHGRMTRPAPAPRFSRTPAQASAGPEGAMRVLAQFGIPEAEAARLATSGILSE